MTTQVGFTGSQHGMTDAQRGVVEELFDGIADMVLHHGDCIGADAQADAAAAGLGYSRHAHPPVSNAKRAFCATEAAEPPLPYRDRDLAIVRVCDRLIAAPSGEEDFQPHSGTWMTVRMARRHGKPVRIVWPDGTVT